MRVVGSPRAIAPSSQLLSFLRVQADEAGFLSSGAAFPSLRHVDSPSCFWGKARNHFSSCSRQPAALEANILTFDFLPLPNAPNLSRIWTGERPRIVIKHRSQDTGGSQRRASHDSRPFLRRLLAHRKKSTDKRDEVLANGLPGLFNDPMGTVFGRSKAGNDLKLRCTEFDENGNVTLVNGEFRKSELIAKYGLLPRDLRKIDSSLLPSILVRPSAILVNLLHLRVLIKHDHVLVFDAYGSTNSYAQSVFMYDLEGKLQQKDNPRTTVAGGLPYEFRALEAILISVTGALEAEFEGIREPVVRVLRDLEEDIDRDTLRHLLVYSKKLGTFEQKARLVRDAIDSILEEDEDLSAMYLSEAAQGQDRAQEDHTEIEVLLESYYRVCDEIVQNSGNLVSNIRNTEEIIKAILDANRNSLMLLDLKFSIGTLGIGSGAFVAALYGMNLKNFIEESDLGFWGVSGISAIMAGIVCVYGMRKLRKVQRVSMWGEQGHVNRGNWRAIESATNLPREAREERTKRMMEERKYWGGARGALIRRDEVEAKDT